MQRTRQVWAVLFVMLVGACSGPSADSSESSTDIQEASEASDGSSTDVRYRPLVDEGSEAPVQNLRFAVFVEREAPPHELYLTEGDQPLPRYCNGWGGTPAVVVEAPSLEVGSASREVLGVPEDGVSVGVHENGGYRGLGFLPGGFEVTETDDSRVRGTVRLSLQDRTGAFEAGILRGAWDAARVRCP